MSIQKTPTATAAPQGRGRGRARRAAAKILPQFRLAAAVPAWPTIATASSVSSARRAARRTLAHARAPARLAARATARRRRAASRVRPFFTLCGWQAARTVAAHAATARAAATLPPLSLPCSSRSSRSSRSSSC